MVADPFYNFKNLSFATASCTVTCWRITLKILKRLLKDFQEKQDYFNPFSAPSLPNKVAGKMLDFCKTDYAKIGDWHFVSIKIET